MKRFVLIVFGLLLLGSAVRADNLGQVERHCATAKDDSFSLQKLHDSEQCGISIYHLNPVGPYAAPLPPQNGFAFGIRWTKKLDRTNGAQDRLTGDAVAWKSGGWEADTKYRTHHCLPQFLDSSPCIAGKRRLLIDFAASTVNAPTVYFYGIGPTSNRINQTSFGFREFNAGVDTRLAIGESTNTSRVQLGGSLHFIFPTALNTSDISQRFAGTPGLQLSTYYVVPTVFGILHQAGKDVDHAAWVYQAGFSLFHSANAPGYSFGRFLIAADDRVTISGHRLVYADDPSRALWLQARLLESTTNHGEAVPFFMQPTLGGSTFQNQASVRAYQDYRYRAPNLLLLRAEYRYRLWGGPIALAVFYDAGKVALAHRNINFHGLKQSYGVGLLLYTPYRAVVFHLYYALAGSSTNHFIGNLGDMLSTNALLSLNQ